MGPFRRGDYTNFASASLFKKPSSIALSNEFMPSFVSPSFCNSSRWEIIFSHDLTRSRFINLGFKISDLKTFLLSVAIKYVSAMESTQVSMSAVKRSNSKCLEYSSVDQ